MQQTRHAADQSVQGALHLSLHAAQRAVVVRDEQEAQHQHADHDDDRHHSDQAAAALARHGFDFAGILKRLPLVLRRVIDRLLETAGAKPVVLRAGRGAGLHRLLLGIAGGVDRLTVALLRPGHGARRLHRLSLCGRAHQRCGARNALRGLLCQLLALIHADAGLLLLRSRGCGSHPAHVRRHGLSHGLLLHGRFLCGSRIACSAAMPYRSARLLPAASQRGHDPRCLLILHARRSSRVLLHILIKLIQCSYSFDAIEPIYTPSLYRNSPRTTSATM